MEDTAVLKPNLTLTNQFWLLLSVNICFFFFPKVIIASKRFEQIVLSKATQISKNILLRVALRWLWGSRQECATLLRHLNAQLIVWHWSSRWNHSKTLVFPYLLNRNVSVCQNSNCWNCWWNIIPKLTHTHWGQGRLWVWSHSVRLRLTPMCRL